jgi:hypothetical protein
VRLRFQPWQLAVVLIAVCVLSVGGIYWFRLRGGSNPADLVSFLPATNATLVYIDVEKLRSSGILGMITGTKAAEELEYQQFVDETGFDYRLHLNAVAAAFGDGQVFFVLRGIFNWKNIMAYAVRQGGSCHNSFCTMNSSQPHRRISFYPLRTDLMAMATSPDDFAAYQVTRKSSKLTMAPPEQPVWMLVPSAALKDTESLPAGTKAYAAALQNAEQVVFKLGGEGDHLQLSLDVTCHDAEAASALLVNFENTTSTLRKWIAREHQQPNPTDLSGVLAAGTFHRDNSHFYGQWPISRAFVTAVAGGPF